VTFARTALVGETSTTVEVVLGLRIRRLLDCDSKERIHSLLLSLDHPERHLHLSFHSKLKLVSKSTFFSVCVRSNQILLDLLNTVVEAHLQVLGILNLLSHLPLQLHNA
jgi:hypothetical protein